MLEIVRVNTTEDIAIAKDLFVKYADSLGFDLGFQNFKEELANLPGKYAPPNGCLLLAKYQGQIAGCMAIREFTDDICEGKRLYVRPQFRGLGIGRKLMEAVFAEARRIGYSRLRGDTVGSMQIAQSLYGSLGFKEIEPYYHNPVEGAKFVELEL